MKIFYPALILGSFAFAQAAQASENTDLMKGPYIFAHAGWTKSKTSYDTFYSSNDARVYEMTDGKSNNAAGGVGLGYNFKISPALLLGAEADITALKLGNRGAHFTSTGFDLNQKWLASARARLGWNHDYSDGSSSLIYVTVGADMGRQNLQHFHIDSGLEHVVQTARKNSIGLIMGGGLEYQLPASRWRIRAEYLHANDNKMNFVKVAESDALYASSHFGTAHTSLDLVRIGVAFAFGGRKSETIISPPTPPAPPPPPPAPPVSAEVAAPAPVCNKGPFIVYFDWNKADITPEASAVLDTAVSAYGNCNNAKILLAGYADRSGQTSYNLGLSQRRASAVRSYLSGHGIVDGVIASENYGEDKPRLPTEEGVREMQNRRVEITFKSDGEE